MTPTPRLTRSLIGFVMAALMAPVVHGGSAGLEMTSWTIDGGGGTSEGGDLELSGTIGQFDAGTLTGGDIELSGGFWTERSRAQPADDITIHLPYAAR